MQFFKYHGTGNDFILIDGLQSSYSKLYQKQIALLCHRRFGIGADGLMIMEPSAIADFKMVYYNSDGNQATMCGNGGRCIARLFFDREYGKDVCRFEAADGLHTATLNNGLIELEMHVLSPAKEYGLSSFTIHTGSPHYVKLCDNSSELDQIIPFGRKIRHNSPFEEEGINVNLVLSEGPDAIRVRTYERGVEDETYSCGTGVVASALVYANHNDLSQQIYVETRGGKLSVRFQKNGDQFLNVTLIGPAVKVFEGEYYL